MNEIEPSVKTQDDVLPEYHDEGERQDTIESSVKAQDDMLPEHHDESERQDTIEPTSTVKTQSIVLPKYHDEAELHDVVEPTPRKRSWWRKRKNIVVISVVLIVIILGGVIFKVVKSRSGTISYLYTPVVQGNLSLSVDTTGVIQASTYNLDFSGTGIVHEIDVSVGQTVTKGQTLAKLDSAALQDTLKQLKDNGASQDAINVAQDNVNAATLTAPSAGVVTTINGSIGGRSTAAQASSGTTSNATGFIQIVDESTLQVLLNIDEAKMSHVAKGEAVSFSVDAYPNHTFTGTIDTISHLAQTIANVVTYPVTVDVDQKTLTGAAIFPGMTASATVTVATRSNALLLPINAVSFAQQAVSQNLITSTQTQKALADAKTLLNNYESSASGGGLQDDPNPTYVLEVQNGKYVLIPVVLGLTDGTSYQVLAGLTGSSVVVAGQTTTGGGSSAGGPSAAGPVPAGGAPPASGGPQVISSGK